MSHGMFSGIRQRPHHAPLSPKAVCDHRRPTTPDGVGAGCRGLSRIAATPPDGVRVRNPTPAGAAASAAWWETSASLAPLRSSHVRHARSRGVRRWRSPPPDYRLASLRDEDHPPRSVNNDGLADACLGRSLGGHNCDWKSEMIQVRFHGSGRCPRLSASRRNLDGMGMGKFINLDW